MTTTAPVDRPAQVRRAVVELVAERGLHGASMAAIAQRAGVATGTAYVHYRSKEDLVIAAYTEVKAGVAEAALEALDPARPPDEQFRLVWHGIRRVLVADPMIARFLVQIDASPLAASAHAAAMDDHEMLSAFSASFREALVDLPVAVLYDLSLGPIVRVVAAGEALGDTEVELLAASCWKAITR